MGVSQFGSGCAEKWICATRPEVDAHHGGVLSGIYYKRAGVGSGHDSSGESFAQLRAHGIVDPEFVFMQVDHELDRPARHDALAEMRRRIVDLPKPFDEVAQRVVWTLGNVLHT